MKRKHSTLFQDDLERKLCLVLYNLYNSAMKNKKHKIIISKKL